MTKLGWNLPARVNSIFAEILPANLALIGETIEQTLHWRHIFRQMGWPKLLAVHLNCNKRNPLTRHQLEWVHYGRSS